MSFAFSMTIHISLGDGAHPPRQTRFPQRFGNCSPMKAKPYYDMNKFPTKTALHILKRYPEVFRTISRK
eukprot:6092349-Amphidinium_carterae.1